MFAFHQRITLPGLQPAVAGYVAAVVEHLHRRFGHADVHALANQVAGNGILVPAVRNKIVVGDFGKRPDSRFKRWQAAAACRAFPLPDRRCGGSQPLPLKRLYLSNFGQIRPKCPKHPVPWVLGRRFFAELTPHTDGAGKCVSASRSQQKIVWCKPQNHGIIGTNRMVG